MKKILLLFGLISLVCGQAPAQDTIVMDSFPNKYMYVFLPDEDTLRLDELMISDYFLEETERYFTKDTLQVYGIAVFPMLFKDTDVDWASYADTTLDSMYFFMKIYEAEPDSLRTLGKLTVHLRDTPITYYMQVNKYDFNAHELMRPLAVYEAYFDSPITVSDSFYIGYGHQPFYLTGYGRYSTLYCICVHRLMRKNGVWDDEIVYDTYKKPNGEWRYYSHFRDQIMMIFPILTPDTTGGGTGGEGDDSLAVQQMQFVDRLVAVQPNPATERVKVVSSCGMERLTAYDAAGKQVYRQEASGLQTTLDVSRWPAGTYILHVQTPMGTSTKRLVVTR